MSDFQPTPHGYYVRPFTPDELALMAEWKLPAQPPEDCEPFPCHYCGRPVTKKWPQPICTPCWAGR